MADPVQSDARTARLAAALRANLARRKARDRGAASAVEPGDSGDAGPALPGDAPSPLRD